MVFQDIMHQHILTKKLKVVRRKSDDRRLPETDGSGKNDAPNKSPIEENVITQESTSQFAHLNPVEPIVLPPSSIIVPEVQRVGDELGTRVSQITTKSSFKVPPMTKVPGPTVYQQLQLEKSYGQQPPVHSSLNIRAPPPFTDGYFTTRNMMTLSSDTLKKLIIDGGRKYLDLTR